ncbi:MAG: single-stranded-DNA-specific exonuclease RecJ [Parcubacteria group bacterium]
MPNWKLKGKKEIKDAELVKKYHPVVLHLLCNRGIEKKEDIEKYFKADYETDVLNPFLFADMEKAMARIAEAKEKKEKIAIYGDYDADGVTATALLFETLEKLGFENIVVYIPDRQLEGYGMNMEAVEFLHQEKVNLIITVDCGITSQEEIEKAAKLKMDVIITDHHHVPQELPKALAIINANVKGCQYPEKNLAGVGVAFKLAQALYQKMKPQDAEQLKWSLDLVAIGTVADCVPLLGENRVLAKYGLIVLSKTKRKGLLEMFKVGRISISEDDLPDTHKISFQVAPRINAAGRMDHASFSYKLMIEKDSIKARDMALEVENKNQSRQKITGEITREARAIAENMFKEKKFIFAENEHWPVGLLGLVAGKISDEFNKPTLILQKQDKEFVGSLRSIPQINIIETLEKCSELLIKFGGHSQAAGVRVAHNKIEKFYAKFGQLIEEKLKNKDITPQIEIDMEISADDLNWDLVGQIKKMEPFGEGNEEPVFLARNMLVESLRIVGNGSKHLKLTLRSRDNSPKIFDAIGFGFGDKYPDLKNGDKVDIVFNLQEDEWNGNKKIQLKLVDLKMSENMLK